MRRSQWLRLYVDILDSHKIQTLTDAQFRATISMWCLARLHGGVLPEPEVCAFRLRISLKKFQTIFAGIQHLFERNAENKWVPHDWNELQYENDVSTERVKRFRKRFTKRHDTVSETPSDTDTETETDTERETRETPDVEEAFCRIYSRHPKKTGKILAEQYLAQDLAAAPDPQGLLARIEAAHREQLYALNWTADGGRYAPKLADWLRDKRYLDEVPNGDSGPGLPEWRVETE